MTYEEKKACLWRYRTAKRFELLKLDELAMLQTDATHTTQRFSPVPGGSGDGQALPRSVERIDEARRAAEAARKQTRPARRPVRRIALIAAAAVLVLAVGPAGATGILRSAAEVFSPLFGGAPAQTEIIDKIGYPVGASDTDNGVTVTADAVMGDA